MAWGRALSTPCPFGIRFLLAEFLSKISKLSWRWKLISIGVNLTPWQAHWAFKKMPLGGGKDEHFSCVYSSCQLGLKKKTKHIKFWQLYGFFFLFISLLNYVHNQLFIAISCKYIMHISLQQLKKNLAQFKQV